MQMFPLPWLKKKTEEQEPSATEKFIYEIKRSLETEPHLWYIAGKSHKFDGSRKILKYKKAPAMVFLFDPRDGEIIPFEPEEIRANTSAEATAKRQLAETAKRVLVTSKHDKSSEMMMSMFLGQSNYHLIEQPKYMSVEMHNALSRISGEVVQCKNYLWFTDGKDATFFKLAMDGVDRSE